MSIFKIKEYVEEGRAVVSKTSLEIAELTGYPHVKVLKDVEDMYQQLSLILPGKVGGAYVLRAREAQILITGYSVLLRAYLVDHKNLTTYK